MYTVYFLDNVMNAINLAFFLTHHKECNLFTLLDNIKNAMKVTFFLTS